VRLAEEKGEKRWKKWGRRSDTGEELKKGVG